MVWWQEQQNISTGEHGEAMSSALAGTIGSLPLLFAGTSRYAAAVLAVATAGSMIVAEYRRRQLVPDTESVYTRNFNKAVAIAATVVLSLSSACVLLMDPGSVGDVGSRLGFASLVGAGSVLPGTYAEMAELESKRLYTLYWMPMLFALALLAMIVFAAN